LVRRRIFGTNTSSSKIKPARNIYTFLEAKYLQVLSFQGDNSVVTKDEIAEEELIM
jgi:hypothetical protein